MKKLKLFVFLFVSIFIASNTYAKDLKTIKQVKSTAIEAINFFGKDKIKEGFSVLRPHWPIPKAEIDNLIYQTESQWDRVKKRFGSTISVEFVRSEKVGNSLVKYLFMHKFEIHIIRWELIFYKSTDTWKLNSLKWDDNIELLF